MCVDHKQSTLVAEGRSNREIAAALIISENTAKHHVAQLLNKLDAGSRAEAVARRQRGLSGAHFGVTGSLANPFG